MNPAAEALLAMSCESNTGEPITYFFYESDETDRQLKLAAAQANHYTKRHAEWRLLSGGSITVDYTVTPFGDHDGRSEEHTSELQSQSNLVCRLLLEKKNKH